MQFEPVVETPFGGNKAEVRIMYIWLDELLPVMTIIRMGRGLMMGVDHNRNMEWVGSSAGFYAVVLLSGVCTRSPELPNLLLQSLYHVSLRQSSRVNVGI